MFYKKQHSAKFKKEDKHNLLKDNLSPCTIYG